MGASETEPIRSAALLASLRASTDDALAEVRATLSGASSRAGTAATAGSG